MCILLYNSIDTMFVCKQECCRAKTELTEVTKNVIACTFKQVHKCTAILHVPMGRVHMGKMHIQTR